jgi:TRAP-type C4-dicarboxylate transport system permease small subunit
VTTTTPVQRLTPGFKLGESVTKFLENIAAAGIILMVLHVLANVFMRKAYGQPIQGTNEYVGYIWLPAIVMIGFVVSVVRGQIIDADIFYSRLPKQIRREVRLFTSTLSTIVSFGFAWYSAPEALHAMSVGAKAPASDVYIAPITILVPFAFGALTVLFAVDAVRAIRGRFDDEGSGLLDLEGPDLLKGPNND